VTYAPRKTAFEQRKRVASQRFFETPQFQKLEKIWNLKLRESGFADCEDTANTHGITYNPTDTRSPLPIESVQQYYRMVGLYSHHAPLECDVTHTILLLHSDGIPIRDIAQKTGLKKDRVHRRIAHHRDIMLNRAGDTHVIRRIDISRDAMGVLALAAPKRLERFVQISEIFERAEMKPASPTEKRGGEYE
jgi:hypothetical protein